ncbi:uncharacterized protein taf1c [Mugil cephalus]|uniref:uncharacterized protein taf1c n=1 Tax=Mugil cephalus TaxID=48193 RepID=UPI001FB6D24E|nr:uncharacterized protein taf1c [Mugil cephalus]
MRDMDYQFPPQLFPSFYNCGPPNSNLKHCAGNWGSYNGVRLESVSGLPSSWTFTSKHQVRGETWRVTEPVPLPLLSPKKAFLWPPKPPDVQDFTEHMENFFVDHSQDAFSCMSDVLGENFNFKPGKKEKYRSESVSMWRVKSFLDRLKLKLCLKSYNCPAMNGYSSLLSDVVHDIPPDLLGSLLQEELREQRKRLVFSDRATGGALAFVPFSHNDSSDSLHGCLLYPRKQGLDCLTFHKVELQHHKGGTSCVDTSSHDPLSFQLTAPIRQISFTSLFNEGCVGVRSDYLCGVWRFSESNEPRLLQAVNTREMATCISVSPHILGEVLVASESGAANLWTVGKGMQKVRVEDSNLYFNAKSSWRWCEFSAHPRVMLYADRTGVELTDIRANPASGYTLFRISSTADCRSGERLVLSRYLRETHSFHHLITTQYSAYIMDERFPCVPMLKWDHMMQSPPVFCHVIPGSSSSGLATGGRESTTKVLLGSQSSQEITMLQYSGGRAQACFSRGPPQALLRPRDSLKHLPVQIPRRLRNANNRLSSPAAGIACIQKKAVRGGQECMCILQLTEAGDIFYQILEPEQQDAEMSRPPAARDEPVLQQAAKELPQSTLTEEATPGRKLEDLPPGSQPLFSDTSSDEGIVRPTQSLSMHRVVAKKTERDQRAMNVYSDSDCESSEASKNRKQLQLPVIVNDEPELDEMSSLDEGVKDDNVAKGKSDNLGKEEVTVSPSQRPIPIKVSSSALVMWKHWLQKLMQKCNEKKPRPHCSLHPTIETKGLFHLPDNDASDVSEEECVQSLRQVLRSCMSRRSLLVHSTVSASLRTPDIVPLTNQVDTEAWTDPLSQRLTLSWKSEEAWRAWWTEHLGMNREAKVQALRKKRRKEKEAKRAAGSVLDLSGSFTSSVSYQTDLDDFSDSTGWSSATSQGAWSDAENKETQSQLDFWEHERERALTPSTIQMDTPDHTPATTPQVVQGEQGDRQTPSRPHSLSVNQPHSPNPPASQRRNKRPADDILSVLFAPQEVPSHNDFPENESPVHPNTASTLFRSSQSQRSLRVDLSKEVFPSIGSSQTSSFSQSSQGRQGLSQASQPKKKKSRMGF